MKDLFNLHGKVIVVTGATGTLGGGTARYLLGRGSKVVFLGRDPAKVDVAAQEAKSISRVLGNTAMGRFGAAEEIFGILRYFLSDASSFTTGTVVPVDGGFSSFSGV